MAAKFRSSIHTCKGNQNLRKVYQKWTKKIDSRKRIVKAEDNVKLAFIVELNE